MNLKDFEFLWIKVERIKELYIRCRAKTGKEFTSKWNLVKSLVEGLSSDLQKDSYYPVFSSIRGIILKVNDIETAYTAAHEDEDIYNVLMSFQSFLRELNHPWRR